MDLALSCPAFGCCLLRTQGLAELVLSSPAAPQVYLSFMAPDATYSGGTTWAGTGIQFSSDAAVVKGAIALLKQRNPATKVLVAVGGEAGRAAGAVGGAHLMCLPDLCACPPLPQPKHLRQCHHR